MAGLIPGKRSRREIIDANQDLIQRNREFLQSWVIASDSRLVAGAAVSDAHDSQHSMTADSGGSGDDQNFSGTPSLQCI